jgi:hypothetical protein
MATMPEWLDELTDRREVSLIREGAAEPGKLCVMLIIPHSTWNQTDGDRSRLITDRAQEAKACQQGSSRGSSLGLAYMPSHTIIHGMTAESLMQFCHHHNMGLCVASSTCWVCTPQEALVEDKLSYIKEEDKYLSFSIKPNDTCLLSSKCRLGSSAGQQTAQMLM